MNIVHMLVPIYETEATYATEAIELIKETLEVNTYANVIHYLCMSYKWQLHSFHHDPSSKMTKLSLNCEKILIIRNNPT